ncbi:MAG: glycosyltransferase [Verrucomicrobia bacterium]|nr:glycosyltransferase [Pseudomonadota bacterium]NDA65064.1 glycosyltransferase [Verrucomicrobiota bacterium]NDB75532.1 glycosyltransferase [Verrucomicrobiota bacterium]NDD38602.1 glycosyltransferase [Verrucomicrobiota bacterium]NDE98448.1 glycosyltransferase [Verrucomicrobiota bacterium]
MRVLAALRGPELFGSERGNIEVFKVVRSLGAEVCVAVPTLMGGGAVREELERLGFPTVTVPFGFQWSKSFFRREPHLLLVNLWHWTRCHIAFDRAVRVFRPSHVQLGNPLAFNFIEGVVRRHRLQMVVRMGDAPPTASAVQMVMWRRFVRRSTRAMAISRYIWESVAEQEPSFRVRPKRVIYNLAPTPTQVAEEPDMKPECRHVVYLGQIIREKGVYHLLEAAREVRLRYGDVMFHLIGGSVHTGRTEAELRGLAAAAGMAEAVRFHGWVGNAQRHLARATVHVAPSLCAEALGNVVLEAKREGTPSVVFPSGGLVEMIRHGVDGVVCREASSAALAEGIIWCLEQMRQRPDLREAVRADFHERFGLGRFREAWREMYEPSVPRSNGER